jgi:hypothetical protein
MNKHIWAGLCALGLLALASPAFAWGVNCGADPHVGFTTGAGSGGGCGAGPWYTYFPYEAHFALPAPVCFPFWPAPATAGAPSYFPMHHPAPLQLPGAQPLGPQPSGYQPVGYYYYYAPAPTYWYQR